MKEQRFTIVRDYKFEAAHRVVGHPKCGKLHGHSYKVQICISSVTLDEMGFVMDFGDVDSCIKPYIDAMDHSFIVSDAQQEDDCPYMKVGLEHRPEDVYFIAAHQSTAENIAKHLGERANQFLPEHLQVDWVEVQETARNRARWINNE